MIGKLTGKIDSIFEDKIILDVNGVGYNIYASSKTTNQLQAQKGQNFSFLIETVVREDHIHLYGFLNEVEKNWFNELCKVGGVGNKVGMKILGSLTIDEIILALSSGDKTMFARVSGIGPKLALRIVSELKDSAKKIAGNSVVGLSSSQNSSLSSQDNNQILNDAISALENLGYKRGDIYQVASKQISQKPDITLETLITNSLRLMN
ncbi:MAG: Holliday junction DNA helicase RuvA [Lentimonas sp.]|jgi:Holliday junction DNA helicase RuvA